MNPQKETDPILDKTLPLILVSDKTLSGSTIKEIRKEAEQKTKAFWGTRVPNRDLDADVLINRNTVSHLMAHLGPEQVYASLHLPEIIKSARKLSDEPHEPQNIRILCVHRLVAAISFRNEIYKVDIIVKEHAGETRHHAYDVEAIQITKKESVEQKCYRRNLNLPGSATDSTVTLRQLGVSVNPDQSPLFLP